MGTDSDQKVAMKPLLVGESNPYQQDERMAMRYALHPDPPHASGGRLCFLVMGLDDATYLRSFDRVDLCHPKWSLPAARARAADLVAARSSSDVIVLCGSKVASAFGVPYSPFTVFGADHATLGGPRLVVLPHPSGLNRAWHEPGAFDRARDVLRRTGVLSTHSDRTVQHVTVDDKREPVTATDHLHELDKAAGYAKEN